jgi:biopolymer transport protein ExbD
MRKKYARRVRRPAELLLVPMIDIFTVLVTFLLMTAVFSRITILELDLPSSASGGASEAVFRLEVIVRDEGFELTNGSQRIASIPKVDGEYDYATLSQLALALKRDHPDTDDASVLLEPEIAYDHLIQVMDAIRSTETTAAHAPGAAEPDSSAPPPEPRGFGDPEPTDPKPTRVALFTQIAVGDAP